MKNKILVTVALMLVVAMSLSSCGLVDWVKNIFAQTFGEVVELTDAPLNAEKLIDFADGANPDVLFESDGWSNGDVFNVVWKQHNVHYENGIMRLGITQEKATAWLNDVEVEFDYTAGEARTQNYYHYGDYEVSMKPSANGGTASTFFTCTGPYDVKDGTPNPHDEIDIEFLGKDTTHVQFNFFVDGKGGNEYMHELGFDASEGFHTYGYRWEENAITWFVDGVPVYKVTTDTSVEPAKNVRIVEKIPSTPGRILTNYWCGNERAIGWMGLYTGNNNDNGTEYQWIATSAEGAPLNPPVDVPPVEDEEIDWTAIDPIAPTFATTPEYTVEIDGNKANVTYTDVSGSAYKPIEMDVTEAAVGKNFVHLLVTNKGEQEVQVRVNLVDQALVDAGAQNMATNISATMNGVAVNTDLVWGGSFFEIPAGESAELVVQFGTGIELLQLMIDSSRNDGVLRSGNVTVEDIKFAAVGEVEAPHKCVDADGDDICDECGEGFIVPPSLADPVSGNLTTTVGGAVVQLGGNTSDGYGIHGDESNGVIRVEYTNISTNTYKNVWAQISEVAAGKNEISLKIKNNGEETAFITVKIEAAGAVALMEGKMEIPAGEEHEFKGTFEGVADKLYFFIDSGWSANNTTHAGEIVISEIAFSGEATPDVGGDDPVDPPAEEELKLEWWKSSDDYTVIGNNIKYNGAGNSYSCAGAPIAAFASGKTTFTVTITNNGEAASRVRVDIQGENKVGNHTVINTGATGGDVWTDMEWGGSHVTVEPGQSVTLVIEFDVNTERGKPADLVVFVDAARGNGETYSSDITLSGMAFSGEASAPVEPKPEDPAPVEGEYLSFTGNECYTLSATSDQYVNSINVTYTAVSDNTYQNVNTWIQDKAAGKAALGVTIKNNGAETVTITVKLESGAGAAETKVVLAAGETQTVELAYDFAPDLLYFFIDSGWAEATVAHAGDVTISGINFK